MSKLDRRLARLEQQRVDEMIDRWAQQSLDAAAAIEADRDWYLEPARWLVRNPPPVSPDGQFIDLEPFVFWLADHLGQPREDVRRTFAEVIEEKGDA